MTHRTESGLLVIDLYLQAQQGALATAPWNPLADLPPPGPSGAVEDLRREIEALKRSTAQRPPPRAAAKKRRARE